MIAKYNITLACLLGVISPNVMSETVDLDFSNHQEATDGTDAQLGPSYSGADMHFINVGTHDGKTIDAKVSSNTFGDATFLFHNPNYKQTTSSEPNGDIGFLYTVNSAGSAGLVYKFEFFDGTGALSGTFSVPYVIPEFEFIGYDIDGESVQSEQLRVFKSEGFYSYQTGTASASLTAVEEADGSVLFTGPGTNFDEANTSGAVKLVYKNSSTVTLQFETQTSASSPFPNAIFSAFDGNWELSGFTNPTETNDEFDFGDAPDSYGTLLANNGAQHAVTTSLFMGSSIDAESDGQPNAASTGDDFDALGDDDDGVTLLTNFEKGLDSLINVTVVGTGYLQGWADWDMNGSFDADEQIILNHAVTTGANVVPVRVNDDALIGNVQTRFRVSSLVNLPSDGYAGDGEVEDYVFDVTDPGTTIQTSDYYTAAFEDNWPEMGDFDLNDVVTYYRSKLVIKDGNVLRFDIEGTVTAYGASYKNGLAWKLEGFSESDVNLDTARVTKNGVTRSNISPFTGEDKSVASPGGDLVVVASTNLKGDIPINPECGFHRTNPSCSISLESTEMTFSISLPFKSGSEPSVSSFPTLSGFDPFIFAGGGYHGDSFTTPPGKDIEIHTADFAPTSRGTSVSGFYGTADDDSDAATSKYYRTSGNLPWGIIIPSSWNHPSEYIDVSIAYPDFAEWAESGGSSKPTWYNNPDASNTWTTAD